MNKGMTTIAYDAKRLVRNATGLGNYSRTLVADLSRILPQNFRMLLYAPDRGRDDLRCQVEETGRLSYVYPEKARSGIARAVWRSWGIVKDLKRDHVDIYHGLSGELPIGVHAAGIRTVVTIHDLIFLRHPEYYNPIDAAVYRAKFLLTCREADRIIAISECTKRDIMEYGNVDAGRIDVIYQSCAGRFSSKMSEERVGETRRRLSLPTRFVLNVGTIEERKNVELAVRALPMLPDDVHLVVVGRRTKYADRVERTAGRLGVSDRLHLLSGIGDDDLQAIYQMAETFVYPSRYEGFGIPIIEAIQSGLPAVACTGSCLEEAGGPDCLYVSPDDPQMLAGAIRQTLRGAGGRAERINRSRQYVRRFENNDTARRVAALYKQIGGTASEPYHASNKAIPHNQ